MTLTLRNAMTLEGFIPAQLAGAGRTLDDPWLLSGYLNGSVQRAAARMLRSYLHRDASLAKIVNETRIDFPELSDWGSMATDWESEVENVIAFNFGLALSIPSDDYLALWDYCAQFKQERFTYTEMHAAMAKLHTMNPINTYNIFRTVPPEKWHRLERAFKVKPLDIATLAVFFDDVRMAQLVREAISPVQDFNPVIDKALSRFAFDPSCKIRQWRIPNAAISMGELSERYKLQCSVFDEAEYPNTQTLMAQPHLLSEDVSPVSNTFELQAFAVQQDYKNVPALPRYAEFQELRATSMAESLAKQLRGSGEALTESHKSVLIKMVSDLEDAGVSRLEFYLRHVRQLDEGHYLDLIEKPIEAYRCYIEELLEFPLWAQCDRKLQADLCILLLNQEPVAEVLKCAKSEAHLRAAYRATANKLFMEKMKGADQELMLQEDLAL
jgi:hypothetical protein